MCGGDRVGGGVVCVCVCVCLSGEMVRENVIRSVKFMQFVFII